MFLSRQFRPTVGAAYIGKNSYVGFDMGLGLGGGGFDFGLSAGSAKTKIRQP